MSIMQMLLAGGAVGPKLTARQIDAYQASGAGSAIARVDFVNDGQLQCWQNGSMVLAPAGEWLSSAPDTTNAALFEVRATLQSGSAPTTGTMNTWQALNVTRSWTRNRTIMGGIDSTILFEIRRTSTGVVEASAVITLYAEIF